METIEVINRTTRTLLPAFYLASLLSVADKRNVVLFTCRLAKEALPSPRRRAALFSCLGHEPNIKNHPVPQDKTISRDSQEGRGSLAATPEERERRPEPGSTRARIQAGVWSPCFGQDSPSCPVNPRAVAGASPALPRFLTPPGPQGCRSVSPGCAMGRHRGDAVERADAALLAAKTGGGGRARWRCDHPTEARGSRPGIAFLRLTPFLLLC
jgi:hypothetical protein